MIARANPLHYARWVGPVNFAITLTKPLVLFNESIISTNGSLNKGQRTQGSASKLQESRKLSKYKNSLKLAFLDLLIQLPSIDSTFD